MEIGLSSASYFARLPTEDALLDIGAHGVRLCELFLNSFCEYEPAFIELLTARARQADVRVFSVHPMSMQFEPQLFSHHPRQRADAWRIYESVLSAGKALGATLYTMHGPMRLSGTTPVDLSYAAPVFCDLIALAREYGIALSLENVSWCAFCEPEQGERLLERIGTENLCFTLDVKQALRSGHEPVAFVERLGQTIRNVHLCDAVKHENGPVQCVMPGFGTYDFAALFAALEAAHYAGPAFIEVYADMYEDIATLYESYARICKIVHR